MRWLLSGCAVALLTSACATFDATPTPSRPQRQTIAAFDLDGRLAVRNGGENYSVGIEWRHGAQSDEMTITGPLGQGLARLVSEEGRARLETSDNKHYEAADLDSLTAQVFGTQLPVSGLGRWVLGISSANAEVRKDALGRLTSLSENGWQIDYLRYENDLPDALPELLRARRGDVDVRLKVDDWKIGR